MTQPSMFDLPEPRRKVRKLVPVSSRLTYQAEHARLSGRAAEVLDWLRAYLTAHEPPTSAELSGEMFPVFKVAMDELLYVRRGLSDLQAAGVVEKAGTRRCRVSGRTCATWKLKTR